MPSARPATYRARGAVSRIIRHRHASREALGCVVVRRITDDAGRAWRVREFRSGTGLGLFFRCEVPGIRSEARAAAGAPLESLDEDRLVDLLQSASD